MPGPSFIFVQPHLRFGGAERQTVLVSNKLVSRGYSCTVILHNEEGGLLTELDPRVRVIGLGLPGHARIPLTAMRLRKVLAALEPSLVIIKLWSSLLACSMIDRSLPQHRFNYCEDLDPKNHANFIRFGHLKQRLIKHIFRSKEIVTANTSTVASSMMEVYGLKNQPVIIPSTIDALALNKQAQPVDLGPKVKPRVATVGSLTERKGLLESYEVLRELEVPVEWHLVGEGPLKDFFEQQAQKTSSGLSIVVHGGRPDPYSVVKQCDVLLHNSPSEAFGIVLLEALAVGTPVVAAASIGPSEMLDDLGIREDLIRLYPRGNVARMREAITQRLHSPRCDQQEAISYIKPYSLDNAVDRWIAHSTNSFHLNGSEL